MEIYKGTLDRAKMDLPTKRAYKSWLDQRQRCTNKRDPRYHCYGSVGIRQEYSSREFITWYLKEYYKREYWSRPQCGRIDHSKNYTLDNIELVECSENTKERNVRIGNPTPSKPISFKHVETGEIRHFTSAREAARLLGVSRILKQLKVQRKSKTGWLMVQDTTKT